MDETGPNRRDVLGSAAMAGGLLAAYGTFFYYAGRFLYPSGNTPTAWLFVTRTADFPVGHSMSYKAPSGASILVTRKTDDEYLALSSTCPHLGCQVRWEDDNNRFFCPCLNGVFNADGLGIEGPPEGMKLLRYPLKVESGLLFIDVPTTQVAQGGVTKPGHDACLEM